LLNANCDSVSPLIVAHANAPGDQQAAANGVLGAHHSATQFTPTHLWCGSALNFGGQLLYGQLKRAVAFTVTRLPDDYLKRFTSPSQPRFFEFDFLNNVFPDEWELEVCRSSGGWSDGYGHFGTSFNLHDQRRTNKGFQDKIRGDDLSARIAFTSVTEPNWRANARPPGGELIIESVNGMRM
jgi:hypothetical protein